MKVFTLLINKIIIFFIIYGAFGSFDIKQKKMFAIKQNYNLTQKKKQ